MWIKTSLIALGLAGAMAAATPAPTLAQGVHIGPGGVGIDIGPPGYRERAITEGASMTIMPMTVGTEVAADRND
jgi:hypothetical protein